MKLWTRTTHLFNNETREWEFDKRLERFPETPTKSLGVHGVDSGHWMKEEEIIMENELYFRQEQEECPTRKEIIAELHELEIQGMVKSKEA